LSVSVLGSGPSPLDIHGLVPLRLDEPNMLQLPRLAAEPKPSNEQDHSGEE